MSTVEKYTPPALPVWTSWDPDGNRLAQWHKQPYVSQLVEGGSLTLDYRGLRKCWRVYGWRLVDEFDLVESIKVPQNPNLGGSHE
ncbi:hypothetical protein [Nocardia africana]